MKNLKKPEPTIYIYRSAYDHIKMSIGSKRAETGGPLFGNLQGFIITNFVFDPAANVSSVTYTPNIEYLNRIIKSKAEHDDMSLLGFVHSHPRRFTELSPGDQVYLEQLFAATGMKKFICPIIQSKADGGRFEFHGYIVYADDVDNPVKAKVEIIDDRHANFSVGIQDNSRLLGAVDTNLMKNCKILAIGAGGADMLYQSLARTGLGKLRVIDFDLVEEHNLTRGGFDFTDIGRLKVEALGDRLKAINPGIEFLGLNDDFCKMREKELDYHVKDADLLLFLTDSFAAQKWGNIVALRYGKPAIFAGLYPGGQALEVFFQIPGVTPACFRCALSARYKMQANGSVDPPSTGSTIFHSTYLDSVIGMLTLAILHNDTEGYSFSNWFGNHWTKNFLQIRLHPAYSSDPENLFHQAFSQFPGAFNFEVFWQSPEPEAPPAYTAACPDCGGNGNLKKLKRKVKSNLISQLRETQKSSGIIPALSGAFACVFPEIVTDLFPDMFPEILANMAELWHTFLG